MSTPKVHLAHYDRYLWQETDLIVVLGDVSEITAGHTSYLQRYDIVSAGPRDSAQLERLFAAASLAAVSLPERESWGWSVALPGSSVGFFVGVEPEGMICGRCRSVDRTRPMVMLQRHKGDEPLKDSHYVPRAPDPVRAVQDYFDQAEQRQTRLAVGLDGRGVLVQPLPGGRFDLVRDLTNDQLIEHMYAEHARGSFKRLEEVLIFYECRCDEGMIRGLLTNIEDDKREELWDGTDHLDVECPRCGREYKIRPDEV